MEITLGQLTAGMKSQLKFFRIDSSVPISNSTIHKDVLSDESGLSGWAPKRLYKGSVRFILRENGDIDPDWPSNWFDLSVIDLANKLLEDPE